VNELAGALYLEKSTASRLARGLEESGLVERSPDPEDRRSVRLAATAAGRSAHAGIEADLQREYATLLEDFEPEVRSAMTQLLGRLTRAVGSRVEAEGGSCCVVR
jgi:DNA-binding MarR family transcriptional regulator